MYECIIRWLVNYIRIRNLSRYLLIYSLTRCALRIELFSRFGARKGMALCNGVDDKETPSTTERVTNDWLLLHIRLLGVCHIPLDACSLHLPAKMRVLMHSKQDMFSQELLLII